MPSLCRMLLKCRHLLDSYILKHCATMVTTKQSKQLMQCANDLSTMVYLGHFFNGGGGDGTWYNIICYANYADEGRKIVWSLWRWSQTFSPAVILAKNRPGNEARGDQTCRLCYNYTQVYPDKPGETGSTVTKLVYAKLHAVGRGQAFTAGQTKYVDYKTQCSWSSSLYM